MFYTEYKNIMFYMEYKNSMGGTDEHPIYYAKAPIGMDIDLPSPINLAYMATRIWKQDSSGIELIKCRQHGRLGKNAVDLEEFMLVKLSAEIL